MGKGLMGEFPADTFPQAVNRRFVRIIQVCAGGRTGKGGWLWKCF